LAKTAAKKTVGMEENLWGTAKLVFLQFLLDEINKIDTRQNIGQDIIGRVHEYFLGKFALAEGKSNLIEAIIIYALLAKLAKEKK
jgi:type I restriction-modification system DNA methylase subunit